MPSDKAKPMGLYHYRQLQRTNTPSGKTVAVRQTKLPLSWTSVNNKLISPQIFYTVGVYTTGYWTEGKTCGHLAEIFASIRDGKIGWRWMLGQLLKQTGQENNGTIPPHQNPKNSVCMHLWENWCWHCSRINEAKSRSTTVTSVSHCDLLNNYLRSAIRTKLHRLQSSKVFI
jgi:hypothetical protein